MSNVPQYRLYNGFPFDCEMNAPGPETSRGFSSGSCHFIYRKRKVSPTEEVTHDTPVFRLTNKPGYVLNQRFSAHDNQWSSSVNCGPTTMETTKKLDKGSGKKFKGDERAMDIGFMPRVVQQVLVRKVRVVTRGDVGKER